MGQAGRVGHRPGADGGWLDRALGSLRQPVLRRYCRRIRWRQRHRGRLVDLNYAEWVGTEGVVAGDPLPVPDSNDSGIGWLQRPEGYYVSRTLLEVDKLVNIAAMKTHDIPGVTLLHKQYIGTFMQWAYGARNNSKMDLHRYGNERVPWGFMDMFAYRPTDYGIVEGFWGTEGRGLQWGDDVNHNVVVAGSDPVAVDAVAATVMGYNPEDLVFLRLSAAKGFGTYDLDRIQIRGDDAEAVRRDFDKTPNPDFWGWCNRRWLVNGPYASADIEEAPIEGEAALEPVEGQEHNGIAWRGRSFRPAARGLQPGALDDVRLRLHRLAGRAGWVPLSGGRRRLQGLV